MRDALLAAIALTGLLLGCSGEETSLELHFVTDPRLSSQAELLQHLEALELTLDAPDGFPGVTQPGPAGSFAAKDTDGDGVLELTVQRPASKELPRLQLLPGSGAKAFELWAIGLSGAEPVASGGLEAVRFEDQVRLELPVPLNLRPGLRPLRVVGLVPSSGTAFQKIEVELSRPVQSSSVNGNLRLLFTGSAGGVLVGQTWQVSSKTVTEWGLTEERSVARLDLPAGCTSAPGTYRIEATPAVLDEEGHALDQDASDAAETPFVATFVIAGSPAAKPCP